MWKGSRLCKLIRLGYPLFKKGIFFFLYCYRVTRAILEKFNKEFWEAGRISDKIVKCFWWSVFKGPCLVSSTWTGTDLTNEGWSAVHFRRTHVGNLSVRGTGLQISNMGDLPLALMKQDSVLKANGKVVFFFSPSPSVLLLFKKVILTLADLWRQSAQLNYFHYKSTYSQILFIACDS